MALAARTSHLRVRHGHSRVTFVELFFDLVFVFAVTQLSHGLLEHLTPLGALQTAILMLAIWWAWIDNAWLTNWLDPERAPVRMLLFVLMLLGLVASASIPKAFGERALPFALAYAALEILPTHRSVPWEKRAFVNLDKWGTLVPVKGLADLKPMMLGRKGSSPTEVGVYRDGRYYRYRFTALPKALKGTPHAKLAVAVLHGGALDGLGVRAGLAGSSRGASTRSAHTSRKSVTMIEQRNSLRTRNGQVWTLSSPGPVAFFRVTSTRLPATGVGAIASGVAMGQPSFSSASIRAAARCAWAKRAASSAMKANGSTITRMRPPG